jgi:excisionase family DNA binding protein
MTPRDVAGRLVISERAVRNAIARGELCAVKVCRRVRIAEEDFEAWVAAAQVEPIARPEPPRRDAGGTGGLRGVLLELGS